jgi:sulfate permease, SulP family
LAHDVCSNLTCRPYGSRGSRDVAAALLYLYRITEATTVAPVTREYLEDGQAHILQDKDIPSNVTILRIHGPFLLGTTEKLAEAKATKDLAQFGGVVILRLRNTTALDATGIHALEQFSDRLHKAGKALLLLARAINRRSSSHALTF